mmetsp:Transcript_5920/g.19068  ORF Transcript_5920/g.19068 Transcript_5920/m.19068 type:complete len:96 (-) Transcript_5920:66-353(-)
MKHGPIALIDHLMPVVFVAMKDSIYDKVKSNIQEVRARKGTVIAITDEVQCLVCLSRPPMITSRKQIRNRATTSSTAFANLSSISPRLQRKSRRS